MSARLAACAAALLLLAACSATTQAPAQRLSDTPEVLARVDQMRGAPVLRGRALSGGPLMAELPQVSDPAIQREAERILARVGGVPPAAGLARPPVIVLAGTGYHAELNLEGQIAISLGLLANAGTEDEVAFVLAHELSHRLLGHQSARRDSLLRSRQAVSLGSSAAVYGVTFAAERRIGGMTGAGASRGTVAVLTTVPAMHALGVEVWDTGYARDQEIEADRLGFDLLVRARYSPGGAGAVFNQLEGDEQARTQRLANLRGAFTAAGSVATNTVLGQVRVGEVNLSEWLGGTAGRGVDAVMERVLQPVAQTYDSLPVRRAAHAAYEDKHFADAEAPATPNPFATGRLGANVAERMGVLRKLDEADALLRRGEYDQARDVLRDRAVQRLGGARLQVATAAIALGTGDRAAASRAMEAARQAPDATAMTFITLAAMHEQRGDLPSALALLQEGERRFGAAEPFLPHRARILRAMNREAELRQTLAQCSEAGIGDLDRACADAARPQRAS